MTGLEAAALAVGTAVVKSVVKLWLRDKSIAADVSASAIDVVSGRLTTMVDRRRMRRVYDNLEEIAASRIQPLMLHEFKGVPENEVIAALLAVRDTLEAVSLNDDDLFAADLDTGYLDRYVRRQAPDIQRLARLSANCNALYDRVLRESCAQIVEITKALPRFGPDALVTVLQRETEILDQIGTLLERMPSRTSARDFEADYRHQLINTLDRIEFFGVTLSESNLRYPLSVAYITLNLATDSEQVHALPDQHELDGYDLGDFGSGLPIEHMVRQGGRLVIRGEAGSGKTTLLQWMAVRCAARDLQSSLDHWNDAIPFLIRLRRYGTGILPTPERFLEDVGRHISDEMPAGWVHQQLRSGRALVMIDGVDELPQGRRDDVRGWLRELVAAFPTATYVVTSRPAAIGSDWLSAEMFVSAELLAMTPADVTHFVQRWHRAVGRETTDSDRRAEIEGYEHSLLDSLASRRHVRSLAANPLLCALLCALHCDRRAQLPRNRMELYQIALQMLVDRRDRDRDIEPLAGLSLTEKIIVLQDLAYWLLLNGLSDVEKDRLIERLGSKLSSMVHVVADASSVCQYLLERSGILREPAVGRVDFVHRTFQEYLAAKAIVDHDDIDFLSAHAHLDQWQEVVVLAAGHAARRQREKLLRALLARGDAERTRRTRLHLLAIACLETSPELDARLRADVQARAKRLLPPSTLVAAKALGKAGAFVLDLIASTEPRTAHQTVATIRAVTEVGGEAAMRIVARFGRDPRRPVVKELLAEWPNFDVEQYAQDVLADSPLGAGGLLDVKDVSLVAGLRHLRGLRQLHCSFDRGYGNINYIVDLKLSGFYLHDQLLEDMSPLVGKHFDYLRLYDIPRVRSLTALTEVDVSRLGLGRLTRCELLLDISTMVGLKEFALWSLNDLTDLVPLHFLDNPEEVALIFCSRFVDLSTIARWSGSLKRLWLNGSAVSDLSPVVTLKGLQRLNLYRCRNVSDLSPLAPLESLTWLYMLEGPPTVDLTPLKGKAGLLVTVSESQKVIGEDLLGRDSLVKRSR